MPTFLYRLQPTRAAMLTDGPTPEEKETVNRHFAYLKGLTEQGAVLLAGRTQTTGPETFGIVVFRAADEASARSLMENDPAVRGGVMTATLYPFGVALLAAPDAWQAATTSRTVESAS
jgi:uncharacterized protein